MDDRSVKHGRLLFYVRGSGGNFTNLQLYAYRRSLDEWRKLQADFGSGGSDVAELRERCVFAVVVLALSLSQLLGQNNPTPKRTNVPPPKVLLKEIVTSLGLDASLQPPFDELIDFYDAARHFGATEDESKYAKILELDYAATHRCFATGVAIWSAVIAAYSRDPSTRLDEFDPAVHPADDEEYYAPEWPE